MSTCDANRPVQQPSGQDAGRRADRRRRLRGAGARDLRRQRADRADASCPARSPAIEGQSRSRKTRPSRSSISTPAQPDEMQALERLMARIGTWPPVVVVTQAFDETRGAHAAADAGRRFPGRSRSRRSSWCAPARASPRGRPTAEATEAQIYTFLPAVGGAGVTTLAVQSAMLLLNSGQRGKSSTCLVDLDFQHGACADYLDLEPRLNLGEIEPRPERLDRQLLEVMLSHHPSGLAVIAAPNRPAEMRSFDPDVVTRAARHGLVAFRLRRVRHAAHLVLVDRQRAARLEQAVHRQRDDGAGPAPRQAAGRGDPRAAGRRPEAAGDRQSLRAEDVLVRPAQERHRAGARRFVRGLHPQPLRPRARGDRPRRSARRGQAGQQDHAAAQEADPAAAGRQGRRRRSRRGLAKKFKLSWAR